MPSKGGKYPSYEEDEESAPKPKVHRKGEGRGEGRSHNDNGLEMVGAQTFGRKSDVALTVDNDKDVETKVRRQPVQTNRQKCCSRAAYSARVTTKILGVGLMVTLLVIAILDWPPWIVEQKGTRARVMTSLFACGLFIVATEDITGLNKSAFMLLLAATMWTCLAVGYHPTTSEVGSRKLHHELDRGLQDVGSVILFLLPAMGVVESMDHFGAFVCVTVLIQKSMKGNFGRLMPILCFLTFFLSSVIDNLTATIVSLKILRRLVPDDRDFRHRCGGLIVMAANAGGAWSAIGDVTTTMLWIQGKISTVPTAKWLFVPSLVSGTLPVVFWSCGNMQGPKIALKTPQKAARQMAGHRSGTSTGAAQKRGHHEDGSRTPTNDDDEAAPFGWDDPPESEKVTRSKVLVMTFGIFLILLVPVLKMSTGLPPYLGMLLALGSMWLLTDNLALAGVDPSSSDDGGAWDEEPHNGPPVHGVVAALHKVDLTGLLFFTGVLLAIGALNSAGVLRDYASAMVTLSGNSPIILCTLLGLSSAVVDNVPLVEASINMFTEVPKDDPLWQLIALAAGTGGSILNIGSVAGVTFMSMEGVGFLWYCRRVTPWALLGFFSGLATFQVQRMVMAT